MLPEAARLAALQDLNRAVGEMLQPLGFWCDNPGGEWLRERQTFADRLIDYSQRGPASKGAAGANTAYLAGLDHRSGVLLRTEVLRSLQGVNNENRRPGEVKYDWLARRVAAEGWNQTEAVHVVVNHRGDAFLFEGNTRVAVASAHGIAGLWTTIYYFNGGEQALREFHPLVVAGNVIPETQTVTS